MAARNPDELLRHFSNAVINWKISNISLALCPPIVNVTSPDFTIFGPTETSWRLNMCTSKGKNEQHIVILYLELLGSLAGSSNSASASPTFKVRGFANISNSKDKSFVNECELSFTKRKIEVKKFNIIHLMQALPQEKSDELDIACYILIDFDNRFNPRTSVPCGLVGLSNSLVELPKKALFPDWRVTTGTNVYHVHKDMLLRRGDGLKFLINKHGSDSEVSLNEYDEFSVGAVFRYLYSGNLESILSVPRISIYFLIEVLKIPELQNVYPKEIINIETHVEGSVHVYNWEIEDFESLGKPISSPEFRHRSNDSRWQLHFYPKGTPGSNKQSKKFAFLIASLVHSDNSLDVCVEVTCNNENDKIIECRRVQSRMTEGNSLEIPLFYRGGVYERTFFIGKPLLLCFTFRIATGEVMRIVNAIQPSLSYYMTNNQSLVFFSRMMGKILEHPGYPDFLFQHQTNYIRTHKFLLAARCPTLKVKFLETVDCNCLTISNINKHDFRVFLEFLYTGLLNDYNYETVIVMYDLARFYGVPDLMATAKVSAKMTPQNVLEILMYADDRKICDLKSEAIQLIGAIGETITEHPVWNIFAHKKPSLALDLIDFIRRTKEESQ